MRWCEPPRLLGNKKTIKDINFIDENINIFDINYK